MNITDPIRLDGIQDDAPENIRPFVGDLVGRIDMALNLLMNQLRAQPHIFTSDPDASPEDFEGAKEGDFAVYKDNNGNTVVRRIV